MQNPFLQYLISIKALKAEEAEIVLALHEKGGQEIEVLLADKKYLDDEKLLAKKAEFYHLPAADLSAQTIARSVLELLPKEIITNYQIVPFAFSDNKIQVAMLNPENLKAREAVDFLARQQGRDTAFYVMTATGLKHALEQYGNLTSEVKEALGYADQAEKTEKKKLTEEKGLEEVVKSAPVSKMVNVIFRHAIEGGASDIHIEPGENDSRVRYRIDGILHTTLSLPKYIHPSIISRIKVLANLKLDETRKPQDGRIHVKIDDKEVDLRVSTMPLIGNEKVVMRILDVTRGAPKLAELGFMGRNLQVIEGDIHKPNGLLLVTGPTGSGKSTTLFAAMSLLNQEGVNIVTLEDPVEYFLAGANQAQVRPEVGFTFASGLRSILRQDPDIIMVGEIRDAETAELAVQAALTGHIVLSTLHTNDALGAIPRLLDMEVESFLLASTINILVAQRLVRRLCQNCKEESTAAPDMEKIVAKALAMIPDEVLYQGIDRAKLKYYKGKGCAKCGGTGHDGRLSICEVIENNKNFQAIIYKGFNQAEVDGELKRQGFIPMMQDGIMKALLGLTTLEEVVIATKE
ncbi:MAG: GspE/PulE family protein [Patescibacteria group bacterium]